MRVVTCTAVAALVALAAVVAAASPLSDLSAFNYQPLANPSAIVQSGNARFTVLSSYLIRMEYSSANTFEDRATLAIVNRNTPVPQFTQSTSNGKLTIQTSAVTLTYQTGTQFSSSTLTASMAGGANWQFGQADSGNLLGTIKSLDELCNPTLNCNDNSDIRVHSESLHCTWGVVSTNGVTTYNDTKNYLMSGTEWFTNAARGASDVDIYLFGHGTNFKAAVRDLNRIAGKQPLSTKNLYGSWYTRWFDFDNDDVEKIITNYKRTGLPLDVLILDMNWHTKDSWTGYTWDKQLFPVPSDTVAFAHAQGLKIGANLHDAVGFGWWEEAYTLMATTMGISPSTNNTVPFLPLNQTYMQTMEDKVLAKLGFDIWWIDWQQGGNYGGCDGNQMNPTFITDHVRGTDKMRRGENKRDDILARWGGMGTQRYPVGFSGDVSGLSWQCFAYQPYFVATAANVGYGGISNDLVGPPDDHELHVRWMQFGAFSPIMRIHDRGMSSGGCWGTGSCAIVDMWYLPYQYLDPIRDAMLERSALQPYIYTMNRNTFDNGLTLVRPMYYEFPSHQEAYSCLSASGPSQYMFGDDMFVNLVTTAATNNNLVRQMTWIPPGTWYDVVFGELVTGPNTKFSREYILHDIPRFVRAGAVIPRVSNPSDIGVAGSAYKAIDWQIFPGAATGAGQLYEDDGTSLEYISSGFAWTTTTFSTSGTSITVNIGAANGSFTGQLSSRNNRVVLVGVLPLSGVTSNGGNSIPYARFPTLGTPSWTYDGATASAIIDLGACSILSAVSLTATFVQADTTPSMTNRMAAISRRTMLAKRTTDNYQQTPGETVPFPMAGYLKQAAAHAGYISATVATSPQAAVGLMANTYLGLVTYAMQELSNPNPTPMPEIQLEYLVQLWDFGRSDMLLCASYECIATNGNYQILWIEGFQPLSSDSGTTPLYDYYSDDLADNWATTSSTSPQAGYSPAIFTDGAVFASTTNSSGRNCVDVWFLDSTQDHMTVASAQGTAWAVAHGYRKVNSCIGTAYAADPRSPSARLPTKKQLTDKIAKVLASRAGGNGLLSNEALTKKQTQKKKHLAKHKRAVLGDNNDPIAEAIAYLQSIVG